MLTKGDDYPIHQRPEPVAYAGATRNFYDRYFFNGYALDGEGGGTPFFAAALGVYPQLNIMDASFSIIHEGIQHNIHASKILHMERMDTRVGPIEIEVVEPLEKLRIKVDDPENEIAADLLFEKRAVAIEEPRFIHRIGPRTLFDYTRLTQNGTYRGWIEIKGHRIEVEPEQYRGTRDRSWGVRPVGAQDSQAVAPPPDPQFYWLWAPLNFEDHITLCGINEDENGKAWHASAVVAPVGEGEPIKMSSVERELTFKPGTRHAASARLEFKDPKGRTITIRLKPKYNFYMAGLGYMHPEWGHGVYKGEIATGYETYDLKDLNEAAPLYLHVQAFCDATLEGLDGGEIKGAGVLEQLFIGPHEPSGFKSLLDMAP